MMATNPLLVSALQLGPWFGWRHRPKGFSMTVSFPNQSRIYDSTRNAVRFWGNDSAMEASFFVTADALRRIHPGTANDQDSLLRAFDSNRQLIYQAATRIYKRGSKGSYELVATNFARHGR